MLLRPKAGEAGCSTGVLIGVLAAVDGRGEWERGGGVVSWESSFTVRSGEIVGSCNGLM